MKNVETSSGEKGERVKLIRKDSIGPWSWDSSELSINYGYGINEWSVSDMMTVLNNYYYNGLSNQTCYVNQNNASIPCDFSKIKFPENAKSMIEEVVWNTGSIKEGDNPRTIKVSKFYEYERSNNIGRLCMGGKYCNDNIERTTKWTGKIGLSYPSDYGYATSGGTKNSRKMCLNTNLFDWRDLIDCNQNDWFYNNGIPQYFMTPIASSSNVSSVFGAFSGMVVEFFTHVGFDYSDAHWSLPTIYLKPETKIINGEGTISNPYILE